MKRSQLLAVSVVALMVLSSFPAQSVQGQGAFTEKLNVFVAGSNALWYFTFGGLNASSKLSGLESTPGLGWYNVSAIKTTGWQSDFQVFGARGYDLLPVPFVPSQGMFLTVGSDSYGDASAAAAALDSYLLTSFVSLSNGTGTYAFYSPLSFNDLVPGTLFKLVPTAQGGFSNALNGTAFMSTASPFVVLEGVKSSSGFSRSLVIGSIASPALDSTGRPSVMSYFGGSVSFLQASSHSSSSTLQLRFLDGVVRSSDPATVSNSNARFTGSYTLTLAAGKRVSKVNATVAEQPAPLLATRAVDVGVLRTNDDIAVTLSLRNLSPSDTITKVAFTDNWWNKTGGFKFLGGNYSGPDAGISPGGSVTPVYRLQYTGTSTGSVTIPASVVRYTYEVGSASFDATAVLNPIRLSLGADDAVVYATVAPVGGFGKPVGASQDLNVTVTNVGTLPASSVVVAGHSIAGLAAKSGASPGGSASVTVSQSAAGLLGVNVTSSYSTTYQNPSGTALNATTNVYSDIFSHASMLTGYPTLTVSAKLTPLANQTTDLTLSFSSSNAGSENVTSFKASGSLPPGLGCGKVGGKGLTCSGDRLTISYPVLNKTSALTANMTYAMTNPHNYIIAPIDFHGLTAGNNVTGGSDPVAVPGGLVLSKQFAPSQLFGGMSSEVTVAATNAGPAEVYNASVATTIDSFDSLSSTSTLQKTSASMAPGGNSTFSYGVSTLQVFGTLTGAPVAATFFFGATRFSTQGAGPKVQVYQPVGVSITTTPASPEEGKNFTINIQIDNPSGVSVSNVNFTLPVPSGLELSRLNNAQVSAGLLSVSEGALGAHSSATASASAVASSGILVPFKDAKLTFSYAGVTINGTLPSKSGIGIGEDVTTRYLIPTAFVLLVLLATAFYVRRKAAPIAPASQK